MADKTVLMEITKDQLETGLRGVPVGYCTTSSVDPQKGLFYVGEPVEKIADRDPEDVVHLLLEKRWPKLMDAEGKRIDSKLPPPKRATAA